MKYIKAETPDSHQCIIEDLFDTITLFENKTETVEYRELKDKRFEVTITFNSEKFRTDSSGNEKPIGFNEWIDLGVFGENDKGEEEFLYLQKRKISKKENTFKIIVNEKPTKAGINPIN